MTSTANKLLATKAAKQCGISEKVCKIIAKSKINVAEAIKNQQEISQISRNTRKLLEIFLYYTTENFDFYETSFSGKAGETFYDIPRKEERQAI